MKYKLCVFFICVILLCVCMPAPASVADDDALRTASDAMLRTQLRLRDLGYYNGCIDGTSNSETRTALQLFCENSNISSTDELSALLFATDAIAAQCDRHGEDTLSRKAALTGVAMPWDEANDLLVKNTVYTVTACHSGVAFSMRCVDKTNHAHMTPSQTTDVDALLQLFGSTCDYSKQPVVIQLGIVDVAASLQAYLHNDEAGDADTQYSLYFMDSVSDVGSIPDADHANTVRIAAGDSD